MTPGQRLRARLDEIGWSQLRLANEVDVDAGTVSRWVSGKLRPGIQEAFAIERSEVALPAATWAEPAPVSD